MTAYTDRARRLLAQYHDLKARQDVGDFDATDILIDLHYAIESAGMTQKQREAFNAVFMRVLTQKDAAKALGISERAFRYRLSVALVKFSNVLEAWDYLDIAEGT